MDVSRAKFGLLEFTVVSAILGGFSCANIVGDQVIFVPNIQERPIEAGRVEFGFPFAYLSSGISKEKLNLVIESEDYKNLGVTLDRKLVTIFDYDAEFFGSDWKAAFVALNLICALSASSLALITIRVLRAKAREEWQ